MNSCSWTDCVYTNTETVLVLCSLFSAVFNGSAQGKPVFKMSGHPCFVFHCFVTGCQTLWWKNRGCVFDSLAPGKCECNFKNSNLNHVYWLVSSNLLLIMPCDECHLTEDKWTLVQVMAWCCQATNHYLSQCSSISVYVIWSNKATVSQLLCLFAWNLFC